MFMGEYQHNLDAKGRLIIPAKFREQAGNRMIFTRGLDGQAPLDQEERAQFYSDVLFRSHGRRI